MPSERLSTGDLILTRVVPADAEAVAEAVRASWRELAPWMPWASADYGVEEGLDWITFSWRGWREGKAYEFVVRPADDPTRVLGTVGLNQRRGHEANLGFWIRTDQTGRGVCTRAAARLARFGLEEVGLERLVLRHLVDNVGSQRVAEKVGFRREGVIRRMFRHGGRSRDVVQYSLVDVGEIRG